MEEQTVEMRRAEQGVNQISGVVQSNAATAQQASATSQELSAQASCERIASTLGTVKEKQKLPHRPITIS